LIAWLLLACAPAPLFEGGLQPLQHSEPRSAKQCQSCHPDQTEQWSHSRHASAWTNPVFAASIEPTLGKQWCMNCHAPLPQQQADLAEGGLGLAAEGVNCAVCHLRDGKVLTSNKPSARALAQHAMRRDKRLSSSEFCAGCHEFDLIDVHARPDIVPTGNAAQSTHSEWAMSAYKADTPCQSCHMSEGSHRFPGAHDPTLLTAALSATVVRSTEQPGFAMGTVTSHAVGHATPSGDPFRRLELWICADPTCTEPLERRGYHRFFRADRDGNWRLAQDHSVPSPERGPDASHSRLIKVPDGPASWQLRYFYGDPKLEAGLPQDEVYRIVDRGELSSRSLP